MEASKTKSIKDLVNGILPEQEDCAYTKCYCEENVWMLCNHIRKNNPQLLKNSSVIFISNPNRTVPLWVQKSQICEGHPVVWDYHVVLLLSVMDISYGRDDARSLFVFDLDSILPFPTVLSSYIFEAFQPNVRLKSQFQQYLKVIPADYYLSTFASDRSHMKKEDGSWLAAPPNYPCLSTQLSSMNLDEFINMDANSCHGNVYSLQDFITYFHV